MTAGDMLRYHAPLRDAERVRYRITDGEKGERGRDHDEGRKYQGLKRHMIRTSVSHLFLAQAHRELRGEKPGVDGVPGADRDVGSGEGPGAVGPVWYAAA